jgi:beta-glucosidase
MIRYLYTAIITIICLSAYAQTVDEQVESVLNKMTTSEKIYQLTSNTFFTTGSNTRLDIPGFNMSDGPHGVRFGGATCFPTGIAQAATWDVELIERLGKAMGEEFWSRGKHQQLGPCLDLCRDPRNGRSPETLGEDPYLASEIAVALVKGIQQTPVIATAKHFNLVNRQQYRHSSNTVISERWLMEHYGLDFRMAVQVGGVQSIMNAYNLINGVHCSENPFLLQTILRDRWGFPFYVVSDWGAVHNTRNAIHAGTDICMGSDHYANDLPGLINSGQVDEATLDEAVRRVLKTKIMSGMMNNYPRPPYDYINTPEHNELALEAGRKTMVLLKNEDNILPLEAGAVKVALIGPSANKAQLDGFGSSWVEPTYTVSPRQGIEKIIGSQNVEYVYGCDINSSSEAGFPAALAAAEEADVVIYVGGLDDTQEGEGYGDRPEYDRAGGSVDLPGKQQKLINELASVNENIIVVLKSGGICGVNNSIDNIKGLVYAFYPGQEGGNAIAEVLFGLYNPGGKLPVTMPKGDAQLPPWNDNFNDDFGCGYRWFDEMNLTPEFAFGFGLSYTEFEYSNIQVSSNAIEKGQPVEVSFDVRNTGDRAGEEVAQLYLTDDVSSVWMPVKQLKAFQRIKLGKGETKNITFTLTAEDFYFWDESTKSYDIETGEFIARIGGSSDNLPLEIGFEMTNSADKPDLEISKILTMPKFPLAGDEVRLLAMVRNVGTASVEPDEPISVLFSIDGNVVATIDSNINIPVGGMMMIEASADYWMPEAPGEYQVQATTSHSGESVITNNQLVSNVFVYDSSDVQFMPNIALNKPVQASSIESTDYLAAYAVDGDYGSRWSSQFSDPQDLVVKLLGEYEIHQIRIQWEAAYSDHYEISVSQDGDKWEVIVDENNGQGNLEVFEVECIGRFIKFTGLSRATEWGHSMYEFEVFGVLIEDETSNIHETGLQKRYSIFPNPVNDEFQIKGLLVEDRLDISIFNTQGKQVKKVNMHREEKVDVRNLNPGFYFVRIEGQQGSTSLSFIKR